MSDSQKLGRAVDLCSNLKYGINALNAMHTAMVEGSSDPSSFTDGLYCIWDYLSDKVKALDHLLEDGEE